MAEKKEFGSVIVTRKNNFVTITMNRPEKLNALSPDLCEGLLKAFKEQATNADVRAVILTGAAPSFSAGGDVREDIDPLKTFMKAKETQYATWKELLAWYEENSDNLHELGFATETEPLDKLLGGIPYKDNTLRNAKKLVDGIRERISKAVEARKDAGKKKIDNLKESLQKMVEYGKLSPNKQIEVMEPLSRYAEKIGNEGQIKDIKLAEYEAKERLPDVRERIHIAASPEKAVKIVYATELEKNIAFPKAELVTEEDVLNYTDAFKKKYLSLIAEHKRIGL